jgi:long-subunit acyl-CoA synthetase (AMP-forming)
VKGRRWPTCWSNTLRIGVTGSRSPTGGLYTSGSTGRAKGVIVTQRSVLFSSQACYLPIYRLSPLDRLLCPLPVFHAFPLSLCVVGVVAAGASAHLVDGGDLLATLREYRPTVLVGVPTTYHLLVSGARADGGPLPSPRMCVTAGAPCSSELRADVAALLGARLLDAYGSTETSGMIAVNGPEGPFVEGSCGPPLPGLELRIVDPDRRVDVADGAEGEIWVRGGGLMLGYANNDQGNGPQDVARWGVGMTAAASVHACSVAVRGGAPYCFSYY